MDHQVEFIARAFYNVQDDARVWENESEELKDSFRKEARAAIALLNETQQRIGMNASHRGGTGLYDLAALDRQQDEYSNAA